ncbi:MAG: hypothetical protein ABIH26_13810 [Candidatus Eisenbacteria bacterium]
MLENVRDPRRQEYLERFADREGQVFIRRFYGKYKEKNAEESLALLAQGGSLAPVRLAALHGGVVPDAGEDELGAFLRASLPQSNLPEETIRSLHKRYGPGAFSLVDRGFITRVHPLEVWTVGFLRENPGATLQEAIAKSREERIAVYGWLFRAHRKDRQDRRIRMLLEVEAFQEVHRMWKNLGYPFASVVPSFATAIGSSGDRPAALAELVGIIQNGGVRFPSIRVKSLHFAEGTPFETLLRMEEPSAAERVLPREIADVLRRELVGVVEEGTAGRLRGAFASADGTPCEAGGKTGTGDNRRRIYGAGGELVDSIVMSRTATFVFLLGDRFYGTVVAYVEGTEAGGYRFTSALPVQVLKLLGPALQPLLGEKGEDRCATAVSG